MKKIMLWAFVTVLILVSVFVTVYLLNYNEFNVAQFGRHSVLIMDEKIGDFEKNDLLIVEKNNNDDIKVGDYIFFYDTKEEGRIINYGKVYSTYKVNEKETTFTMDENYPLSSEYVIGKSETSKVFSNIGFLLAIFASQWGFLLLVIFPVSILFVYQIYLFVLELQYEKRRLNKKG